MAEKQKNYKRNNNFKKESQSSIGVWTPTGEKQEKEKKFRHNNRTNNRTNYNSNYKPKNNQQTKEEKIPTDNLNDVIEYCTLVAVEQYFEDIGKESESFIPMSRRIKFVKPATLERVQRQADKIMEKEIKKLSKEFINSKVEITNYMRSIKVTDGFDTYLFVPEYKKGQLNIKVYHKVESGD